MRENFNYYYMKQQDAAGNESEVLRQQYQLDTKPPLISLDHTTLSTTNDLAVSFNRPMNMTNEGYQVKRVNRLDWLDLKSASEDVKAYFVRTTDDNGVTDVLISDLKKDDFTTDQQMTETRMAKVDLIQGVTTKLYLGNLMNGMYSLVFVDKAGNTSHTSETYSDLPRLYVGSDKKLSLIHI